MTLIRNTDLSNHSRALAELWVLCAWTTISTSLNRTSGCLKNALLVARRFPDVYARSTAVQGRLVTMREPGSPAVIGRLGINLCLLGCPGFLNLAGSHSPEAIFLRMSRVWQ
ncbi:hypothetical protein VMCG_09736 [Cytospora schulzeri]|uniref:Uncharacterized protein n=1 Tax=Cytospora schulzeri TaxID=448051 RepID=A0A423VH59_9PEZI|nr:hypothetical protein VMCG_09736 [Valsa malicola]